MFLLFALSIAIIMFVIDFIIKVKNSPNCISYKIGKIFFLIFLKIINYCKFILNNINKFLSNIITKLENKE